jgi:hypothetical protein
MSVEIQTNVFYFNVSINNQTILPKLASFNVNLDTAILSKSSDWMLSIIRFSIPTNTLPLLICPIVPNQGNPNLTPLVFGIFYGGNYYFTNVIWQSIDMFTTPPIQASLKQIITPYYYSYTYDHFISLLNTCLSTVYNLAVAGGLPNVSAPQFVFDPSTQLITLIAPSQFTNYGSPGVPILYCNQAMSVYFTTFDFHIQNPVINERYGDFVLYQKPYNSNGYTPVGSAASNPSSLFSFSQEADLKILWGALKKIVIKSNVGATQEIIPAFNNSTGELTDSFNVERVLQDFIPNLDLAYQARMYLNYSPTAQYRLVNLSDSSPLRNLDLQIYWTDVQNNIYPLFISPNQLIDIKIGFFRKSSIPVVKQSEL